MVAGDDAVESYGVDALSCLGHGVSAKGKAGLRDFKSRRTVLISRKKGGTPSFYVAAWI